MSLVLQHPQGHAAYVEDVLIPNQTPALRKES